MRSDPDWQVAQILADPQEAFVLWVIHRGLCRTQSDFARLYGSPWLFKRIIRSLRSRGFIEKRGGRLVLTTSGLTVMDCLGEEVQRVATAEIAASLMGED